MSYEHWRDRAERGLAASDVAIMVFAGKYDEKLNAEISLMLRKQSPVYLLLKVGEQPPIALETGGLIQDIEFFNSNDDFPMAAKKLVDRIKERKKKGQAPPE